MQNKNWTPDMMPRERLERLGPQQLGDDELVALILRSGGAGQPVLELARALVKPNLAALAGKTVEGLAETQGLGPAKAAGLVAAFELGRRLRSEAGPAVSTPEEAYVYFRDMGALRKETMRALYLDARRRLLRVETVSIGTLTMTLVHPREVFQPAVETGAAMVVLAHNHPSGDPAPSAEDHLLTRRLFDAGELLGIQLVDHLVIGRARYVSLREIGSAWSPAGKALAC